MKQAQAASEAPMPMFDSLLRRTVGHKMKRDVGRMFGAHERLLADVGEFATARDHPVIALSKRLLQYRFTEALERKVVSAATGTTATQAALARRGAGSVRRNATSRRFARIPHGAARRSHAAPCRPSERSGQVRRSTARQARQLRPRREGLPKTATTSCGVSAVRRTWPRTIRSSGSGAAMR